MENLYSFSVTFFLLENMVLLSVNFTQSENFLQVFVILYGRRQENEMEVQIFDAVAASN